MPLKLKSRALFVLTWPDLAGIVANVSEATSPRLSTNACRTPRLNRLAEPGRSPKMPTARDKDRDSSGQNAG
jgi:hypothetical protein